MQAYALFLQLTLIRYPGLVWIKSDLPPSCRSVQLVYLAPSPTLSATTKPPSDQVRRDSLPDFICIKFTFNFSRSQRRHLRCCVPCVGTMRRASTMGCVPVRAARGSSRDPSGRRQGTSAGGRGSVSSPRVRGTDVSIVVSGKREMVWIQQLDKFR